MLLVAACVGTNPRWDGVEAGGDDDGAASTAEDDAADDGSSSGDSTAGESSGLAESTWIGDESSSSPMADDDAMPACPGDDLRCDGECKNVQKDKHACGPECTDCVALFDDDKATCVDSVCVDSDDNSGPGGDDE